jgi:hypothetical protein
MTLALKLKKMFAMTIEEYKEFIVQKLGTASDCEETEQIISRSIRLLKERHLPANVKADYLAMLKDGLEHLSPSGFDYIHWCNIQCAILYLKKLTKQNM